MIRSHFLSASGIAIAASSDINMEYVQFERLIVEGHGVDIVGWPAGVIFANPSKITRLADLDKVHAALNEGSCYFVRLSKVELKAHQKENFQHLNAGEDPYAPRGGEKSKAASRKRKTKENGQTSKK